MARRGYHRHRLSQRVLPHIRDVPRLLSFAGALAGVGLPAAPPPTPPLLLTVTLAAEGKSAEGEAELARIKPRMEKFPLVGGSRLFADLAEGILALKQGEAANAEQRFRAALEFTEQQAGGKHYGAAWAGKRAASRGTDFRCPRGGRRCGPHLVADLPGPECPLAGSPGIDREALAAVARCAACSMIHLGFL